MFYVGFCYRDKILNYQVPLHPDAITKESVIEFFEYGSRVILAFEEAL